MFNWTENISIPKITDVLGTSDVPMNILRVFTYAWVWFLGGWFFAAVIGILGTALYIKSNNAMYVAVFFIVMALIYGGVLSAEPLNQLPSAAIFLYIMGLFASVIIGIVLYMLFVGKKG